MSGEKEYLTVNDVAQLLGVAPVTVRAYAARKQMPGPNVCPCCGLGPVWSRFLIEEWRNGRKRTGSGS